VHNKKNTFLESSLFWSNSHSHFSNLNKYIIYKYIINKLNCKNMIINRRWVPKLVILIVIIKDRHRFVDMSIVALKIGLNGRTLMWLKDYNENLLSDTNNINGLLNRLWIHKSNFNFNVYLLIKKMVCLHIGWGIPKMITRILPRTNLLWYL
jgi:hypothetical protein